MVSLAGDKKGVASLIQHLSNHKTSNDKLVESSATKSSFWRIFGYWWKPLQHESSQVYLRGLVNYITSSDNEVNPKARECQVSVRQACCQRIAIVILMQTQSRNWRAEYNSKGVLINTVSQYNTAVLWGKKKDLHNHQEAMSIISTPYPQAVQCGHRWESKKIKC